MSAVKDVQRSLNSIRALSADENARVQQQILELMLQASISQLKSISTEPQAASKDKPSKPAMPATVPIPKPTTPTAAKPKPKPKPEPSLSTRLNRLQAVKPQAPES